jgi:hypothetical protein
LSAIDLDLIEQDGRQRLGSLGYETNSPHNRRNYFVFCSPKLWRRPYKTTYELSILSLKGEEKAFSAKRNLRRGRKAQLTKRTPASRCVGREPDQGVLLRCGERRTRRRRGVFCETKSLKRRRKGILRNEPPPARPKKLKLRNKLHALPNELFRPLFAVSIHALLRSESAPDVALTASDFRCQVRTPRHQEV